jgi:sugar phosphate isomerase/epimerase
MKIGVADHGVDVWEGGLYDLESRLHTYKELGFQGVERLTATDAHDALSKATLFRKTGLEFTTCRGPSEAAGIQWTSGLGKPYVWIAPGQADRKVDFEVFCRRANVFIEAAEKHGLIAGLHNHLGSRVENQEELDAFMHACPKAHLVFDLGHLQGAGGDIIETIDRYHNRIAAVHLKDYFIFDRSVGIDRYRDRLRFCGIGEGNDKVDFQAAVEALSRHGYDGWLFVEHDDHTDEPAKQLKTDLEFARKLLTS